MNVPERIVVYGGLNTGPKPLNSLADAFIEAGFVTPDAEKDVFTLGRAGHDPTNAVRSADDALAVAHSMGNLIWGHVNYKELVKPRAVVALNPIMPESLPRLVVGGGRRFVHHLVRSFSGPYKAGHRQIVLDTSQSFIDPSGNIGRVPDAVSYSSVEELDKLATKLGRETAVVGLFGVNDEFGAPYRNIDRKTDIPFILDPGCHDGALYVPGRVVELIASLNILETIN